MYQSLHLATDSCHQESPWEKADEKPQVVLERPQLEPLRDMAEGLGHQVVVSWEGLHQSEKPHVVSAINSIHN